jgi:hypothetical protein
MNFRGLTFVFAAMTFSTLAHAADDLKCDLRIEGTDETIAAISTNLPADGNLVVTEANSIIAAPELKNYSFSAKVENHPIVGAIIMSHLKLEDKKIGVTAESKDVAVGQFKSVTLRTKEKTTILECYLN